MTTLERIPSGVAAPTTTVADVLSLAREAGVLIVDLRFVDLPGLCAALLASRSRSSARTCSPKASASTARASAASRRSTSRDMLLMPDPTTAFVDPACEIPTLSLICDVVEPGTLRAVQPRPALRRAEGRSLPRARAASPRRRYWGPEVEFYIFNSIRFEPDRPQRLSTRSTPTRASGTAVAQRHGRTSATGHATRRATSRSRRWTSCRTCAARSSWSCRRPGIDDRGPPPRGRRPPARPRSTCASARWSRWPTRCSSTSTSSRTSAIGNGYDGDLHAQADVRRQRLGHAHPPEPVEGRHEPLFYDENGYALLSRDGRAGTSAGCSSTRRRSWPSPRRRPTRYRRLVPGLRGADQPGLLAAQPLGVRPHPDVLRRRPRARRLEFRSPDPSCNPYLSFCGHADGRPGRRASTRSSRRRRSTRTCTSWRPRRRPSIQSTPGSPGRGARRAGGRPRVPAAGATSSPRT